MSQMSRRQFGLATASAVLTAAALPVRAQSAFPNRVVTILVGYPAGGPTDLYARALAKNLSDLWKQPVVVENRAGGSGSIAAMQELRAAPDGYTLLFTNNAANGAFEVLRPKTVTYRTLRDFAPVALYGISPSIMVVRSTLQVKDAREFVAMARANPGKLTYGSSAIGSAPHLASELLQSVTGIKLLHVPFNGAAPLIQAMLGDQIDMYIGGASTVMPYVHSGKLRALAAVNQTRLQSAPEIPTMTEQGFKGVEYASWFGLLASANTPAALLDQINADCRKVMESPEAKAQLKTFGIEYTPADRQQFLQVVREEVERSAKVVAESKITLE